jgi:hypothetical protein
MKPIFKPVFATKNRNENNKYTTTYFIPKALNVMLFRSGLPDQTILSPLGIAPKTSVGGGASVL